MLLQLREPVSEFGVGVVGAVAFQEGQGYQRARVSQLIYGLEVAVQKFLCILHRR